MTAFRAVVFGLAALVVLCSGIRPVSASWPSGPQTTYAHTHTEGTTP